MARSSDPKKLALWQGRFRRFLDSGLAVARFCAVEHVSESSFYYWQKKLGPQALRRPARAEHRDTCAEDHDARAKHRGTLAENRDTRAKDCAARAESRSVFRPVTVVPAMCGVVVRLPGGTRIEVDADHLDAIRAVVAETVRVDHGWVAERRESSDNRNASSGNQIICTSDNQVIRKRGGTVSC